MKYWNKSYNNLYPILFELTGAITADLKALSVAGPISGVHLHVSGAHGHS